MPSPEAGDGQNSQASSYEYSPESNTSDGGRPEGEMSSEEHGEEEQRREWSLTQLRRQLQNKYVRRADINNPNNPCRYARYMPAIPHAFVRYHSEVDTRRHHEAVGRLFCKGSTSN